MPQDEFEMNPDAEEVAEDLETYTIAKLRSYASLYRVPFAKDSTKEEIIKAIKYKMRNTQMVKVADGKAGPAPGFVRVKLMKDSSPKARNAAVYFMVNGRTAAIPRGVACDIPFKFEEAMRNSTHPQVVEDSSKAFNDAKRFSIEEAPSYPFEVLDRTPGPDPWPGTEVTRRASYGPREKFWKLFGRWPRRGEVHDAIKGGFIKREANEFIAETEVEGNKKK